MKPAISVIIPAHNEEGYIRKTLHSLKQQTFQNFETIVVTNGCTDKTAEIVKKRNEVQLYSMTQANVSRARNYGADKSTGEILLFLDADTTLDKDALKKINDNFTKEFTIATFKLSYDDASLRYKLISLFKNFHNSTRIVETFCGSLVCRREDFERVEGFDSNKIIREHYHIRNKIGGKYTVLNSKVMTSARRWQKLGFFSVMKFWMGDPKDYEKIR